MQTNPDPFHGAGESGETLDPVSLEVFRHLFTAAAEEMGAALRRSAFSPNIKERRDYSCAVFSPEGTPVAQGDHMPVHLGAMPMSVQWTLQELGPLEPGDIACLNDPFAGGTHLPDITLVAPVFSRATSERLGYVASRAHHSDVGGSAPGSMPLAREIYQEGLRIPPSLLHRKGEPDETFMRLLLANVRTPDERTGDLAAQLASLHTGGLRLQELAERRGSQMVLKAMEAVVSYGERLLRAGIERIPDGRFTASDVLDDDGFGSGPVEIRACIEVKGDGMEVDFAGSASQVPGGVNAVAAITTSATRYVVRCVVEELLGMSLPAGGGAMEALHLRLPSGSVVAAVPPAAVAAGNVETSQRITDVLFQALAQALPDRIPALSQGTMNNLAVGGEDPRTGTPFTYYETAGGGMGGGPRGEGLSGVHSHMTNSLNTPIEALEHAYPMRVVRYGLRRGSGGSGRHGGGDGLRRDLLFLGPAEVTLLTERRVTRPRGLQGGGEGSPGENVIISGSEEWKLPGKVQLRVQSGEVLSIRTPGGGGWGRVEAGATGEGAREPHPESHGETRDP